MSLSYAKTLIAKSDSYGPEKDQMTEALREAIGYVEALEAENAQLTNELKSAANMTVDLLLELRRAEHGRSKR